MKSHAIPRFWRLFHGLPPEARRLASKTFRLWQANPNHPSLRYRRLEDRENLVIKGPYAVRLRNQSGVGVVKSSQWSCHTKEAKLDHILLAYARSYDRGDIDLAPSDCDYDLRTGAWIVRESGVLLVESPRHSRPPQSKKADVETGEDQKGY